MTLLPFRNIVTTYPIIIAFMIKHKTLLDHSRGVLPPVLEVHPSALHEDGGLGGGQGRPRTRSRRRSGEAASGNWQRIQGLSKFNIGAAGSKFQVSHPRRF